MRILLVWIKLIFILAFIGALPAALGFIFFHVKGAAIAVGTITLLLFLDSIGTEKRLRRILKPSRMEIADMPVLAIEDPSSHAFVTHSLFSSEPTVWITRGALSLLSPEEIIELVRGMRQMARRGALRFETVLTGWLIRLTSRLPKELEEILFFRNVRPKALFISETVRGGFWTSIILLLEIFYFSRRKGHSPVPVEIQRKLEAESRRCVPRLPVALSSHSAVSPWPDAFLTLGRPCFLPASPVNVKA